MIKILCIGKIKEKYFQDAIDEYVKRIKKFSSIEIIELEDEGTNDIVVNLKKERDRVLKYINQKDYIVTLEIDGNMYDSLQFSNKIDNIMLQNSNITFIIGGSYGLHQEIKDISNLKLSFSKMTFPHQLFRVMLLEQIYRSYKILNNERYHK